VISHGIVGHNNNELMKWESGKVFEDDSERKGLFNGNLPFN